MRLRLTVGLAIVTLTAWLLGSFVAETFQQPNEDAYQVDFHGGEWIRAADSGPTSFFRMSFSVEAAPESVTLWLDAQQMYTAWINGSQVASDTASFKTEASPVGLAVDLTRSVAAGNNSVAVQVTNRDGGAAAMIGRVTVVADGRPTDYVTVPAIWRATSNAGLVGRQWQPPASPFTPPPPAPFTLAGFDDSQWAPAAPIEPVRAATFAAVPENVMDAPLRAGVLAGPRFGTDVVVSRSVSVPADPGSAWLRVAATGPYSLFLDGQLITSRVEPLAPVGVVTKARPVVLTLIDLTGFVHSGRNVIAVHVTANPLAAAYVDGRFSTPSGTVTVATDDSWGAASAPFGPAVSQPPANPGTDLGPAPSVWQQGVVRTAPTAQALGLPLGLSTTARLLITASVILAWLLVGCLSAALAGAPVARGLVADAVGHVPALVTIAATEQVARLANVVPPFPHVTVVLGLLIAVLAAGKALASASLFRRWAGAPVPAPPPPALRATSKRATAPPPAAAATRTGLRLAAVVEPISARWRTNRWHFAAICGIAVVLGGFAAYDLAYQPVWQDELASLTAARAMRAHLIPMLPSTLVYWKGELYSALLAVVGAATGDSVVSLRAISVFWYMATIIAFGFLIAPMVLPGRRRLQLALTLLFAIAPAELLWSRDIRMYQMAQFFFVIFVALFYRAMRRPQLRTIAGSAVALVVMYLSHEETFVFLPAIPIVFLAVMRLRWVRDWRWWVFGLGAFALIGGQYLLATASHPPVFGYDSSNKPFVEFDPSNSFYYLNAVYFAPITTNGSLAFVSTFAVLGGVVGAVRRSLPRLYLSAFLWIAVLSLSIVFSPKVGRYTFVTLPALFALAGAGAVDVFDWLRQFLAVRRPAGPERRMLLRLITVALAPAFVWLALTQATGLRDYGLAVARITGAQPMQEHTDYGVVAAYVRAHQQPGDLLLTIAPPNCVAYYVGRPPDGVIATSSNKLLYLMETDGHVVDTTFGAQEVLTASDLQSLMATHRRIWIVTDQGNYFRSVDPGIGRLISGEFTEVAEGATSAVYFREI
jgi:hypothetical protein